MEGKFRQEKINQFSDTLGRFRRVYKITLITYKKHSNGFAGN
jgi:hypothetical protein